MSDGQPEADQQAGPNPRAKSEHSIKAGVVWTALLALFVVPGLALSVESALHFSNSAIDGPFQLYNALRRIRAGFQPGVDFQFFHGLGVPYLHYWLFRLFGGQFVDSELARQLVSAIVFPASLLAFYRAFAGSWVRATCLTATTVALAILYQFPTMMFAGNSMIGVRSALPVMLPALLYLVRSASRRIIGGGLTLGCALFLSTEQGLAAVAAFAFVSTVVVLRGPNRKQELAISAATLGIAGAILFALLALFGGFAGAVGAVRYNFKFVPMDQYWFFGVPPNPFVRSWSAGFQMAMQTPSIGLALVLAVGATGFYVGRIWKRGAEATNRDRAFALLAVYALVSCTSLFGVFIQAYVLPCWRVLMCLTLLELTTWADQRNRHRASPNLLGLPKQVAIAAFAVSAVTLVLRPSVLSTWGTAVPHVLADHVVHHEQFQANPIWLKTLAIDSGTVKAHSGPNGKPPIIWSTYSGWLEARSGVFNPSFDYLIHALGPANRRAYVQRFRETRPGLVQTVSPLYSPYEVWIENTHWDFYRALLSSYAITAVTPWSLLWEPRSDADTTSLALASIEVPVGVTSLELPAAPPVAPWPVTLLEVEISYETRNSLKNVPVIGASPRYLVELSGALSRVPVSLDPYATSFRFPLVARPGEAATLAFRVYSLLPGAALTVHRVSVRALRVHPRNEIWLHSLAERLTP